jgi:multidrug efflux pump subunit AcrA (membrane-fusion protein)
MFVVIDATGEKCEGTVGEVVPAADPVTRSFLVKINLQCRQALKTGLFGRAQLMLGERFAMFAPKSAVHERGQLTYIFVARDGRAQMRLVRTGKSYLDALEILSGLQSGERVIVAGEVADGQPVSP